MQQRKNFYLFFKEAINNAAKHSEAKQVTVTSVVKEKGIELTVVDDGKGFDPAEATAGNGLHSLEKRARELKGILTIAVETLNEGTLTALNFKAG